MGEGGGSDHRHLQEGAGKVKIGINATFLNEKPTGVGLYAMEVSRILSRMTDITVVFAPIVYDGMPEGSIHKVSAAMKGSPKLLNSLYRFLYINTSLPVLCKLKGVDLLYCPILEFPFIPSVPLVVHIHDLHFIHFPRDFGRAAPRMKLTLKLVKGIVGRVIVSSEFIKKELLRSTDIRETMIDTVPLAYNDAVFRPMREGKAEFLRKYQLTGKYLLFVGTLFPYKNLRTLVAAFLRLKHQIPHSLVIVGRREFAAEPPARDERIVYMDYVPAEDLPLFYSHADAFVYPSLREGFGIPPLEAMACGTPVISSCGGSLPEVVGEAGILFEPEDTDALGRAILAVVNDERLRSDLVGKGASHVKKFSWTRTAEGILRSCEKAMQEKG